MEREGAPLPERLRLVTLTTQIECRRL